MEGPGISPFSSVMCSTAWHSLQERLIGEGGWHTVCLSSSAQCRRGYSARCLEPSALCGSLRPCCTGRLEKEGLSGLSVGQLSEVAGQSSCRCVFRGLLVYVGILLGARRTPLDRVLLNRAWWDRLMLSAQSRGCFGLGEHLSLHGHVQQLLGILAQCLLLTGGGCTTYAASRHSKGHAGHRQETGFLAKVRDCRNGYSIAAFRPLACYGRPRHAIQRVTLWNMLSSAGRGSILEAHGALWVLAYSFLLRVPSEVAASSFLFGLCAWSLRLHRR